MYSPTYSELKAQLQKELDLEDQTFVTAQELLNYANEAVDMVESAIHSIYEDYFLTKTTLTLVSGQQTYSFPTDIYAQKIRNISYNDGGSQTYDIRRIKKLYDTNFILPPDLYQYLITNDSTSGLKIVFYPTPAENSSNVTIWYLRNAKRFSSDSDVCDIPEFTAVVVQYMRWKCMNKEGHPDTAMAAQDLDRMRQEMVDTLTARVPDENNYVTPDFTFYQDFDDYTYGGGY